MNNTTPPLLTKREYFAAQAMQGLLANSNWVRAYEDGRGSVDVSEHHATCEEACRQADKLLAKLAAAAPAMNYTTPGPIGSAVGEPTWTLYDGGPMPCDPATRVQVKYRCGEVGVPDRADFYLWSWTDEAYDIVAWRALP